MGIKKLYLLILQIAQLGNSWHDRDLWLTLEWGIVRGLLNQFGDSCDGARLDRQVLIEVTCRIHNFRSHSSILQSMIRVYA